jgi:hypothetical protein
VGMAGGVSPSDRRDRVSGMRERASRDVAALVQRAVHLRRLIEDARGS